MDSPVKDFSLEIAEEEEQGINLCNALETITRIDCLKCDCSRFEVFGYYITGNSLVCKCMNCGMLKDFKLKENIPTYRDPPKTKTINYAG